MSYSDTDVIAPSIFSWVALFASTAGAQSIPLLTVCEALHDLPKYNGRFVIVVGRAFTTFDGSFMNEECEPGGTITIEGKKWQSMIAFDFRKTTDRPVTVQWELDRLKEKLK